MKKFLRRCFLFLLFIIILVSGIFYANGSKTYNQAIEETSLEEKVNSIKNKEDFVSINEVTEDYKNAIIAVEDHRFYKHGSIDLISIGRAIISNIKQKDFKEGGSTITQQTAKNLYFIEKKDNANRKIAEIILSRDLENNYSKDEILELYFNTIYFGDGYYGISEACHGYLNKEPSEINISEATMLAGVPNAPSVYAPTKNLDLTQSRQKKVISSMVKYKYLTQEKADAIVLYGN